MALFNSEVVYTLSFDDLVNTTEGAGSINEIRHLQNTDVKLTTLATTFRPVNESSSGPLPLQQPILCSTRLPIPIQDVGNALQTPQGLRVSMGGGGHIISGGSIQKKKN
ncbi:hypothetical protein EVAR_40416_1 [Eumeta japonica]|uniref:Uncharacterized protein n=1 Tax=Eumeta variegata TaxID=151549 RepID=A0A4C1WBY3_EUMVA|nr:hypothetical protein EVAR_40416_1 [Eumeta japonica]